MGKCLHCKPNSSPVPKPKLHQSLLHAKKPWQLLHADIATMDFTMSTSAPIHFVVLRDDYSGLTWIKPVANQTASTFCDLLASWLTAYPCPAYLATDSGPAFRSTVTKLLRQTYKLDAIHHSPMNHKANGSVEVVIRIARQTLAALRSQR